MGVYGDLVIMCPKPYSIYLRETVGQCKGPGMGFRYYRGLNDHLYHLEVHLRYHRP